MHSVYIRTAVFNSSRVTHEIAENFKRVHEIFYINESIFIA
jgi:hypothetical protein